MKKRTKFIAAAAALALLAAAVAGGFLWQLHRSPATPEPMVLPDSGALALPVVSAFSTDLEAGGHAVLFKDQAALEQFIAAYHLRGADERSNYTASLALPKSYDFKANYIFYCYWPLSSHFTLQQCYLEAAQSYVSVQADYRITDPSLIYESRLMQGFLIAVDRSAVQLSGAEQIFFQVEEHSEGETEPPLNEGALRLELVQPLKVGASAIQVRVIPAPGEAQPPKVLGAVAWTLKEYRGYRWRDLPIAPGKEPADVQLEQTGDAEYSLQLDAYAPLTVGRKYRAIVRLRLESDGAEEEFLNVLLEMEAG